jgi:hypothetical protein
MAKKKDTAGAGRELPVHRAEVQVGFWAFPTQIHNKHLAQAQSNAVAQLDVAGIGRELAKFASRAGLSILARAGLRGETFFPIPSLFSTRPELLGYYRLLFGIWQKEFYKSGFGPFKAMETENLLSQANQRRLPELCSSLCQTAAELLAGVQPPSLDVVHKLHLLTTARIAEYQDRVEGCQRGLRPRQEPHRRTTPVVEHGCRHRGQERRWRHRSDRVRRGCRHHHYRAAGDGSTA